MEQVIPFELTRLFLGDDPPAFYLEILFRISVIWLWTIVLLRWIGGRSISQLSLVEFLLVIALGAAVGDAMFYPEVPLLQAMLVILVLVLLDKGVDIITRKFPFTKRVIDGQPATLLRDGVVLCEGLQARLLSLPELMERLRLKGVENLGSLGGVWLEPSGQVSIFPAKEPRPGLQIVPPRELLPPDPPARGAPACCCDCGLVHETAPDKCHNCGGADFTAPRDAPAWTG